MPPTRPISDALTPAVIKSLGLVLVLDPQSDIPPTLVSLKFGCPICEVATDDIDGVPSVMAGTPFERKVARHAGSTYDGGFPGWDAVIAYLRSVAYRRSNRPL